MIRLAAVVGTNADFSYNRLLLKFMKRHFKQIADIDIVEIKDLPAFSVDVPLSDQERVWEFKRRLQQADGIVFSTPEYDHSIPAALKSAVEWLSYHSTVLYHKPAMVVGVSYGTQGSSRAQEHMRQILAAPDCSAYVLPGHEVLIGQATNTFDQSGNLTDPDVVEDLEDKFNVFVDFVTALGHHQAPAGQAQPAATKNAPAIEDAYVTFPTGKLSLREIQQLFSTVPFEFDFVDSDDRFAWFSNKPQREHQRSISALGQPVKDCHPPKAVPTMEVILKALKSGQRDVVSRPFVSNGHRILTQYYAVRDLDGHYLGTMEFTGNVEYILQLAENDAWGATDASTGASQSGSTGSADSTTGASQNQSDASAGDTDASTGASQNNGAGEAPAGNADASTGASQSNNGATADTGVKHDADRDDLPDMPGPKESADNSQVTGDPDASTGASQK